MKTPSRSMFIEPPTESLSEGPRTEVVLYTRPAEAVRGAFAALAGTLGLRPSSAHLGARRVDATPTAPDRAASRQDRGRVSAPELHLDLEQVHRRREKRLREARDRACC